MSVSRYRKEIEGLRGLAVSLVVAYHLGAQGIGGGFVGVDVFFVISGFLITSILTRRLEKGGGLDVRGFWLSRCRRLLPAYFAMMAATLIAAAIFLHPTAFDDFCGQLLAAALGFSNIVFMQTSGGYFHPVAFYRPLLHSWSLAVEFQFYLIWPLVAAFTWRRGCKAGLRRTFFGLGAISLLWAMALAYAAPVGLDSLLHSFGMGGELRQAMNFYLPLSRLFEFALGASVAALPLDFRGRRLLAPVVFIAGVALILLGAALAETKEGYPSLFALAPVSGAAMVIMAGAPPVVGKLLTNPLAMGLGRISYSLYLVHWPLITFTYHLGAPPNTTGRQMLYLALSLILAVLLYHSFERPFRNASSYSAPARRRQLKALGALGAATLAGAASGWLGDGWAWRYAPEVSRYLIAAEEGRLGFVESARFGLCLSDHAAPTLPPEMEEHCLETLADRKNVLLFGDSYAAALVSGLRHHYPEVNFLQATGSWCRPIAAGFRKGRASQGACEALHAAFRRAVAGGRISAVIVSARWTAGGIPFKDDAEGLSALRDELGAMGVPLIIFGPAPDLNGDTVRTAAEAESLAGINALLEAKAAKVNWRTENLFRERAVQEGWHYFSVMEVFYPDGEKGGADFLIEGTLPHSFDQGHLTSFASRAVVGRAKERGLAFD